ncbi:MAG: DUF3618 domain-containing protein [Alphaproteobacteria bacterium]|uniref:DUF3618 domain-containing protein n=1 Tax=Candidatus Nitrobium versatile TaxID=2884831 RepID=A0A953J7L8_9BACT|nr:DUF3618 domain-containing protein [Candidatus Nitrobium versatile]
MDEREDVRRGGGRTALSSSSAGMSASGGSRKRPEDIRADIEQTRADMTETVDAIQEKLSPEHIKEQVRSKFREATVGRAQDMAHRAGHRTKEIGSTIIDTIRQNPIPAAMVGVGLSWLLIKRPEGNGGDGHYQTAEEYSPETETAEYETTAGEYRMRKRAEELSTSAREKTQQVKEQVKEKTQQMKERATQFREQARGQMQRVGSMAQERAQQTRGQFNSLLESNPFALGLAALAIGAAIGLSIPETRKERDLMGEASSDLRGKAKEAAQETMQKVQRVAEEATRTAKEEAQKQGITV